MSTKIYGNIANTRTTAKKLAQNTPQTMPIPGREKDMTINGNGGFSFVVDMWTRLDRFLILGTEGGSYYASEKKLTQDNAKNVIAAIKTDGVRVVNRVVEISKAGRAPKNDPALLVLALALTHGDENTKRAAESAIPEVARIGTHVLHLADYVNGMRGWGRGIRRGFSNWYNGQEPLALAMQLVKYANRDGWTHADILKLAHTKPRTSDHDALFAYVNDSAKEVEISDELATFMSAVEELKATRDAKTAVKLIEAHKLPREVVPTELLNDAKVWEAMLPHMGIGALVRNLGKLSNVGVIAPFSQGTKDVIAKLSNEKAVKGSRIHPVNVLVALLTYAQGHGQKGSLSWTVTPQIKSALDDLFYASFGNVEPTGKNTLICLDVSASMTWNNLMGVRGLTPRVASAALAMTVVRTEPWYMTVGFSDTMRDINITKNMTLDQVCKTIERIPMGGTDCSLPMRWAESKKLPVDTFVMYTDSVSGGYGMNTHASQALNSFRRKVNSRAKMVVAAMEANNISIADPNDAGMMDVCGFDSAVPSLIADFSRD